MKFKSSCARCGATIHLIPPWMHPVYSCDCGPSGYLFAFSTPKHAIQTHEIHKPHSLTYVSPHDDWTPERIARMYSYFREESIEHARVCRLCKAVAEQGLVCPDLENLRVGRNKYLALTIEYPQENKDMARGSERNDNKQLTVKLIEYLRYIAQGLNEKDIAAKLNVSESAIYNRMSRVMDITGCLTCEEIRAYAKEYTANE